MATRTRRTRPVDPERLRLDEILRGAIAQQLRARHHDVTALVDERSLTGLADRDLLAGAAQADSALVTANIKDFVPMDQSWKATGQSHAGIVLVSTKTFPRTGPSSAPRSRPSTSSWASAAR